MRPVVETPANAEDCKVRGGPGSACWVISVEFLEGSEMVRKCWFALAVFLFALLLGVRGQNEALKVVFVSGANEYSSSLSLEKYKKYLETNHEGVQITCLQADGALNKYGEFSDLPGLAALAECDVALLFTRRLTIDGEQLERVKKYVNSGKPIVALR